MAKPLEPPGAGSAAGDRRRGGERLRPRLARRVEFPQLAEIDAFDIAADAAFGERQRHPRFEVMDDLRRDARDVSTESNSIRPTTPPSAT